MEYNKASIEAAFLVKTAPNTLLYDLEEEKRMDKKFLVETSARHVHVTEADLKTLFGPDGQLTVRKELSQPGQFASNERVSIAGPKGEIKNVLILGPERKATQVEISATDARALGIPAIVRESGDVKGSAPIKITGPCGEVELSQGAIVAKRHIHMTPADAEAFGVSDKEIVWVRIDTPERPVMLGETVVRVSDQFSLAMHIDTDEANAAGCAGEVYGEIVKL